MYKGLTLIRGTPYTVRELPKNGIKQVVALIEVHSCGRSWQSKVRTVSREVLEKLTRMSCLSKAPVITGYMLAEVDKKAIGEKYACTKCENILRDPVQTVCGHRYCKFCVGQILRSSESICLVDKAKLKSTEIFPDAFAKREIFSLKVHCALHAQGCTWFGEMRDMEGHQTSCLFVKTPCKNDGCQTVVPRNSLDHHMKEECSFRKTKCQLCGESITFSKMKEHQLGVCPSYPVQCPKCKDQVSRCEMPQHLDPGHGDCTAVEGPCPFHTLGCKKGNKPMQKKEKQLHLQQEVVEHLNFLLTFMKHQSDSIALSLENPKPIDGTIEVINKQIEDIQRNLKDASGKYSEMVPKLKAQDQRIKRLEECLTSDCLFEDDLVTDSEVQKSAVAQMKPKAHKDLLLRITNNETKVANHEMLLVERNGLVEQQKLRISNLERQLQSAQETIRRLERRVESHDHIMTMRNVAVADLEECVRQNNMSSFDGTLLWRIDDFAKKKNDAITGKQASFYSPCFYTSRHGYKMCARIYLNGDGMGKGTHVSVFFVVMRGQCDALLRWPFRQKVTMMLLDQDKVEHVIDAFRPDSGSPSFQRPRREMNVASGCPLFCSLSELNKHAYVRDDTMFIKILVDTSDI